jgi:thymidylate kinase
MNDQALNLARTLLSEFDRSEITYCHWKSNVRLEKSLAGGTDIDLLVRRENLDKAQGVLASLGFKPAIITNDVTFPSMFHYYGFDQPTGAIVHVHLYAKIVTGESLLKNYQLPLTDMLLANRRLLHGIPVPVKAAELIIFVLRMMLKHAIIGEHALLYRERYDEIKEELKWLLDDENVVEQVNQFMTQWLPTVEIPLFWNCVRVLSDQSGIVRRWWLGICIRRQLASYRRYPLVPGIVLNYARLFRMMWQRLIVRKKNQVPAAGGMVIAIVGADASGKTTILDETRKWLKQYFSVAVVHAGKPPTSWITLIPRTFLPLLRHILPNQRSTNVDMKRTESASEQGAPKQRLPLLFMIRATWLGFERKRLLVAAHSRAANGCIVLSDRYPSSERGAVDSPQLSPAEDGSSTLRLWLARLENDFYAAIPRADMIFRITVPVEVALQRNATRHQKEQEDVLRYRHSQIGRSEFRGTKTYVIDANKSLEETLLEVKSLIWQAL